MDIFSDMAKKVAEKLAGHPSFEQKDTLATSMTRVPTHTITSFFPYHRQEEITKTVLSEKDLSTVLDIQPAGDRLTNTTTLQIVPHTGLALIGSHRLYAADQLDTA